MTAPSTIVVLHPHFLKRTGATKTVLEFCRRLSRHRPVVIVTIVADPAVIADYPNVTFHFLGGPTTDSVTFWLFFPVFYYRLTGVLNRYPRKILFAHSLSLFWSSAYKLFHPKTPCVHYYHDLGIPYVDTQDEIMGLPPVYRAIALAMAPVLRAFDRMCTKRIERLVANSVFTATYLQQIYRRPVAAVVSPAVDYGIYRPSCDKEPYLYTVGRLEKSKQIDLIIQGFGRYLRASPQTAYVLKIIGEGVERPALERLCASLAITDRVKFLGSLPSKQVAEVAARARAGLFFRCESFGMAALESLACGTPVIGINAGGIAEFVRDKVTGLLVEPDADQIADAIEQALRDTQTWEVYSRNAVRHTRETYSWERSIETLETVFNGLETGLQVRGGDRNGTPASRPDR